MIKFISCHTGSEMWVHESRMEEYLAAGHKLAAPPPVPEKPTRKKKTTTKE